MKQKVSYFYRNILLFSIGSFVPKLLQFLLVPLYTNCLTPEEYGTADLISVTVSLAIPIFTLGIQDAVLRFALDDRYKKEDVFSVAVKIILSGFLIQVLLAFALMKLELLTVRREYIIYFLVMYLVSALYNSVSLFCRGNDNVEVLVVAGIINSVVMLTANILFLVVLHKGLEGFLQATIAGTTVALLYCFVKAKLYRYIKFRTPHSIYRQMLIFSVPLIANVVAWWVNTALDRYMLSWISGVGVSGIYAVAYKIPNILSVFQGIFFQAWMISAVKEFDRKDSDGFITNVYSMTSFAMVVVCSGIIIFTIPLAKILYAKEFFAAWKYSVPLLVSFVFNAMALFFGSIFTAVKDSKLLAFSTMIGAMVNILANILIIPFFSAYGAAIATLLGYVVVWAIRLHALKKHIELKTNHGREIFSYLLLLVQMLIATWHVASIQCQIMLCLGIILLYKHEVITIFSIIQKRLTKS